MSKSFDCKCPERKKTTDVRNWGVSQRYCNHSAFNGYHQTHSDYSTVHCLSCGAVGRTKAGYVPELPPIHLVDREWQYRYKCDTCPTIFHSTIRLADQPKQCGKCMEWDHDNKIRLQLIDKKHSAGLTETEQRDLDRLQKLAGEKRAELTGPIPDQFHA